MAPVRRATVQSMCISGQTERTQDVNYTACYSATHCVAVLPSNPMSTHTVGLRDPVMGVMATAVAICSSAMKLRRKKKKLRAEQYRNACFVLQNQRDRSTTSLTRPSCAFLNGTEYHSATVCLTWSKCGGTTACAGASISNKRSDCSSATINKASLDLRTRTLVHPKYTPTHSLYLLS